MVVGIRDKISMIYYTNYSIEDCIGLLSRKNIYDVFEYSFEMKTDNVGEITLIKCNRHRYGSFPFLPVYAIKFRKSKRTIIDVDFINKDSVFANLFTTFPPKWITEFMEQKLDAVETKEEDNASK